MKTWLVSNNLSQRFRVCCKTAGSEMVTETRCGTEERNSKLVRLGAFGVFKSDTITQGDLLNQFRMKFVSRSYSVLILGNKVKPCIISWWWKKSRCLWHWTSNCTGTNTSNCTGTNSHIQRLYQYLQLSRYCKTRNTVRVIAKYWTAYLKTITLNVGPGSPLMMAEAFRWHRPCSTTPFTYNRRTTGYPNIGHTVITNGYLHMRHLCVNSGYRFFTFT
jgi:hypothetical protein